VCPMTSMPHCMVGKEQQSEKALHRASQEGCSDTCHDTAVAPGTSSGALNDHRSILPGWSQLPARR
jgi:hypothetical protein